MTTKFYDEIYEKSINIIKNNINENVYFYLLYLKVIRKYLPELVEKVYDSDYKITKNESLILLAIESLIEEKLGIKWNDSLLPKLKDIKKI